MITRKYHQNDYKVICEWFKKRNIPSPLANYLPANGIICEKIACGFLYITDSNLGIIDGYISNPDSLKEERSKALDKITECLIFAAKFNGIMAIKIDSKLESIKLRAVKHKFIYTGEYSSYFREI